MAPYLQVIFTVGSPELELIKTENRSKMFFDLCF